MLKQLTPFSTTKSQQTRKIIVNVQNTTKSSIPKLSEFKKWVKTAVDQAKKIAVSKKIAIAIVIVNNKTSADLNKKYRSKTGPTNILSFPFETFVTQPNILNLGDLIICAPLVKSEAQQQNKNLIAHWAHLTIHGTLHLLGYDHTSTAKAKIMENLEIKILTTLGFNNPY